jgi:NADPH:quinone reductase-like Zn-dependent oxidoreductase
MVRQDGSHRPAAPRHRVAPLDVGGWQLDAIGHSFIDRLAGHLEAGTVKPAIAARFPLDTAIDVGLWLLTRARRTLAA